MSQSKAKLKKFRWRCRP